MIFALQLTVIMLIIIFAGIVSDMSMEVEG